MAEEKQIPTPSILENPDRGLSDFGSITRPVHINPHTWEEATHQIEDHIRDSVPFEGKFQSYIDHCKLFIPEDLKHLFSSGGVITVSTEKHLLLFGSVHWGRYQRLLAKEVGLSPVNNEVARHIYSNMHRFDQLNEDGSIAVPLELLKYADIDTEIAIIGMIYHAEVHDKKQYLESEKASAKEGMLARFRKMKFN